MGTALYTQASNAKVCRYLPVRIIGWTDDLPRQLQDLVVAPTSFDVFEDFEMLADHTHGRDAASRSCYCAFRFVLTELRSDDDEMFYEVPVYAETISSWRLPDDRWLICRTTLAVFDGAGRETRFSVSDTMPR